MNRFYIPSDLVPGTSISFEILGMVSICLGSSSIHYINVLHDHIVDGHVSHTLKFMFSYFVLLDCMIKL